jgi:hypothetical protein
MQTIENFYGKIQEISSISPVHPHAKQNPPYPTNAIPSKIQHYFPRKTKSPLSNHYYTKQNPMLFPTQNKIRRERTRDGLVIEFFKRRTRLRV